MRTYPHFDLVSTPLDEGALKEADLVLLVTDHTAHDYPWIAARARLIVDTRMPLRGSPQARYPAEQIAAAGSAEAGGTSSRGSPQSIYAGWACFLGP